jgi:capsule polysaccharide export protein KpsE/RkpR
MQQLFDKKKRRRESHNAVERRRRDNINERIFELSTLLPERDANKNNKGTILRKSVDHVRLLHEKVNQYQKRVQELETMLDMYRMRWGDLNNNTSSNHQPPLDISGIQPHLHHHHYNSSRDTTT